MTKFILDVGNCGPDFSSITAFLTGRFDCQVDQAHGLDDTMAAMSKRDYSLVLVNRKLDRDYSDGIEIIRKLKADDSLQDVPVMLITNFPEHQDEAEKVGALRGFGKLEFDDPQTLAKLEPLLG